jgi:hypothetical protein
MQSPIRDENTNEDEVHLYWTSVTGSNTGGASIDSYNLQWDNNSNGATWYDLKG